MIGDSGGPRLEADAIGSWATSSRVLQGLSEARTRNGRSLNPVSTCAELSSSGCDAIGSMAFSVGTSVVAVHVPTAMPSMTSCRETLAGCINACHNRYLGSAVDELLRSAI